MRKVLPECVLHPGCGHCGSENIIEQDRKHDRWNRRLVFCNDCGKRSRWK